MIILLDQIKTSLFEIQKEDDKKRRDLTEKQKRHSETVADHFYLSSNDLDKKRELTNLRRNDQ